MDDVGTRPKLPRRPNLPRFTLVGALVAKQWDARDSPTH